MTTIYLLAIINDLSIKEVLHQGSLTQQLNIIIRPSVDRTASNGLGTNVGMTIKGELYFLALVWVKDAVQRQNVKNLQINTIQ